ncbi:MAG: alkaline phosphatase D family protein [Armatimonadota bacterium]
MFTTNPHVSLDDGLAGAAAIIGPLVGHTDVSSTILWARFPVPGKYVLTLRRADGRGGGGAVTAVATPETDGTAKWIVRGLSPATRYVAELKGGRTCAFMTPPANNRPSRVTLAFGSCAREDAGTRAVWSRMAAEKVDAVVLAGDTPYIDSTDLATQRARHRTFAAVPEYQDLLSSRPFWSTWDDHDFGGNDSDGTIPGKENSRQAFIEYRAQPTFGDGKGGIYTSFRWGPIEVFLIDARWWSYTEPSFADPAEKTLLGKRQWEWLKAGLAASSAPFKVLTPGCVWEDKKNREKDDWETYKSERDALFAFIKQKRIGGVVLFGGDIHVTRLLRYPAEFVGYPLYDFISSPMHGGVIPSLNVPHPFLLQSKVQPHTFLTLTADTTMRPAVLTARFLDTNGRSLFPDTTIRLDEITPPSR